MKLNKNNYFTIRNQYLSNSKLKEYAKDPWFFYSKNVLGNVERKVTDALIIGSAVDYWLANGEKKFWEKYMVVTRRSAGDDYEYQLNQTMLSQIEPMCRKLTAQTAYKQLKGFQGQKILQIDMPIGDFLGLSGIPDWFKVKDDTCTIVDLKTAQSGDARKYYYHCLDYGYFFQMAVYTKLIQANYPMVTKFIYRHLVVEKDTDNINRIFVYRLSNDKVEEEMNTVDSLIKEISERKGWSPQDVSWDDEQPLGDSFEDDLL